MAKMTQTDIINGLADKTGLKKAQAKEFFSALAAMAAAEVKKNGEFTLPGFGKLVKATRKAREGRNPATGAVIKIPAKTTVKFRLGKAMKDAVS
jgi:DNA-binding protein HU-beta